MCSSNCLAVGASLLLTISTIAVGIAFFSPYWMSNVPQAFPQELIFTGNVSYINVPKSETYIYLWPDRGLWAQCGVDCQWFWTNGYLLQRTLLTPLKWHLATQILYFVAATIVLFGELFARLQLCRSPKKSVLISLAILLLASALIQVAAVATFGGGAVRWPYYAISDPRVYTAYLGQFDISDYLNQIGGNATNFFPIVYLGWSYWMAVVGSFLTVVSGCLFLFASCVDPGVKDY